MSITLGIKDGSMATLGDSEIVLIFCDSQTDGIEEARAGNVTLEVPLTSLTLPEMVNK